jgi:tetratricopeptide (TPR) repeat protein
MPRGHQDLIAAAAQAHAAGRLDDAKRYAVEALRDNPNDPDASLIAGIVSFKQNQPALAIPYFEQILDQDPESFDAPFWLSLVYRKIGRLPIARDMARRAIAAKPSDEHAANQLGHCHLDLGERTEALACFQTACSLAPRFAPFYDNAGRALQALGRNPEAIQAFRQVLALGPERPAALYRLGDAYMIESLADPAAECAKRLLHMDPNSASGNLLMARALIGGGRVEEGAKFAARAIELAPNNAVPVAYYGRALQSLGRIEEADEQFERSIRLEPRQGFAYHSLVHNHRVKPEDRPLVEKMTALVKDPELPRREIIQLEYGLGKALEDLGDFEQAMSHFDAANRIDHELKVGVAPFSPAQLEETARFLVETFDRSFLLAHSKTKQTSETPIFVVGMMRSGTTLAEQILSSHGDVGGAGEQLFWPENAGSSDRIFRAGTLDVEKLDRLAAEYLRLLEQIAPGKAHVVDKMNSNYLLVGLLHIAFPNAHFVHMRRHPVDTCLSIWATPVANGIDLCARKENVVFQYRQYLRVMEHWRSIIPSDRLLDVQYEQLVSDREPVTRSVLEFCGLEWDEACLRPEKNQRSVRTPSVWQVRQPVYKTSVERWRKYEPWLGAFAELFDTVP